MTAGLTLPFVTAADPDRAGEGSLDPLGLARIAERLADELAPEVTARMSRVHFVTAIRRISRSSGMWLRPWSGADLRLDEVDDATVRAGRGPPQLSGCGHAIALRLLDRRLDLLGGRSGCGGVDDRARRTGHEQAMAPRHVSASERDGRGVQGDARWDARPAGLARDG